MLRKMKRIARPSSPVAIIGDAQWMDEYDVHPNQNNEMTRAALGRRHREGGDDQS